MKNIFSPDLYGGGCKHNLLKFLSISFLAILLVFAGCDNAAAGGSKPTGRDDGNPPPVSDDPRNAVLGTYNNVIIDGIEYTLTFYEGAFGFIKKSASSGNMRAIMPDVPAEGGYFRWALSGNTVIMRGMSMYSDSFTLDFSNSGGTKTLSNLQPVPIATYEWDEATKTLTFKGPGEIKHITDQFDYEFTNKVEKIVIQDGVTIIGSLVIQSMSNLKSVSIPGSVAVIYECAFMNCQFTSVTLPDSTEVFGGAFWLFPKLTNLIVGSDNKYYIAENGILYSKDKTKLFSAPAASGTVSIPSTVTDIGPSAFYGSSLTGVIIPNTVKEIRDNVFSMCYYLSSVTIPNSVTSIGSTAFSNCKSLTSVIIPDSVSEIGSSAFYYCPKLTSITVKATTPPKLGADALKDSIGRTGGKIYVPSASVSAYKNADGWKDYASVIEPIPAS